MSVPIINSMIDDDTYKCTMQQGFLQLYPDAQGVYRFSNRGKHRFNQPFLDALKDQLFNHLPNLKITDDEISWMRHKCPYFKSWYLDYLKSFRYDPRGVSVSLSHDNNLELEIDGPAPSRMMWEVKAMAIISQLYFTLIDTDWTMAGQVDRASKKAQLLSSHGCAFLDMGTRRRRSYDSQDIVVKMMKEYSGFVGTSNMHFAMKHDVPNKGTTAHEWYQAMQALEGIRHSNRFALEKWAEVYGGELGIALPDTIGSKQFLKDFGPRLARLNDGVRWDSGDVYWFINLFVNHYMSLSIDPRSKVICFSNALNCEKSIDINAYCKNKIKALFGIGTFFTNDFEDSPPLNMVIKLLMMNGISVVKTSDDEGKGIGDPDARRVVEWICNETPLDAP